MITDGDAGALGKASLESAKNRLSYGDNTLRAECSRTVSILFKPRAASGVSLHPIGDFNDDARFECETGRVARETMSAWVPVRKLLDIDRPKS